MTNMEHVNAKGTDIIYLDNAATTFPKPESVYRFSDIFYRSYGGNAGRGGNPLARACTRLLNETRDHLATWLGANSPEHIIITSSATHALNLAILGSQLLPGDTIYLTPYEHNSVLRPVEHLRRTLGIQVRQIPFARQTYTCQLDKLSNAFGTEPPALVCVTQASNVNGLMPPSIEIARLAKSVNPRAIVLVDGAQTAGLYPIPLTEGLIDAYVFSGHKSLYGPYGVAGLVLASAWRPRPLLFGGTGTVSESVQMPTHLPSAYETGSHNMLAIAGLHASLEWLNEVGRNVIVERTSALSYQLLEILKDIPGIEIFTPPSNSPWCGIISFTMDNIVPQAIELALGAKDIAVRAGLHCSPWAHEWMNTKAAGGTVRLSVGYFNSSDQLSQIKVALLDLI
jgi:cysteine desulfurase family protein